MSAPLPVAPGLSFQTPCGTYRKPASERSWEVFGGGRHLGTLKASKCNGEYTWGFNDALLGGWMWNVDSQTMRDWWPKRVSACDAHLRPLGRQLKEAIQACRDAQDYDDNRRAWDQRNALVNAINDLMND